MSTTPNRLGGTTVAEILKVVSALSMPSGTITDAMVNAAADLAASKLEHEHAKTFAEDDDTTASTREMVLHVCKATGGGASVWFACGAMTPAGGDATVELDLKVGGVSILSSAVELTSSDTAKELVEGTISTSALSENDVVVLEITATAGTGTLPTGIFAEYRATEKYA